MLLDLMTAVRTLVAFTVITGIFYPLGVHAIGQSLFHDAAQGSLVERDGVVIGSKLIGQKFLSDRYFHPRPSAADFATIPSGASNQGPTSAALSEAIAARRAQLGDGAPDDLLTASGSGLDPHISPDGAKFQIARVAAARGLGPERRRDLEQLVAQAIEDRQFGVFGQPRVNVLALNLALDERMP